MSRINQKPAVADLHRQQILKAAEVLFTEKGYEHTRIEDISRASGYSRRTLYAYYQSKEDILCCGGCRFGPRSGNSTLPSEG